MEQSSQSLEFDSPYSIAPNLPSPRFPLSMLRPEHAGENGFLYFPNQRHGDRHGQEGQKQQEPWAEWLQYSQQEFHGIGEVADLHEGEVKREKRRHKDEQQTVQRSEDFGFGAEGFIGQHRGETLQHLIEIEKEEQRGERHHADRVVKERHIRELLVPSQERRQADVHQPEDFGAVQREHPNPLLLLKIAHEP